jgi:hypothetical protein
VLVEIVEAGLAKTHDFGMTGAFEKWCCVGESLLLRLMRMDADRAPDIVVLRGDGQHAVELRKLRADGNAGAHSALSGARNDFRHLTGEVREI